jgi:flagellar biosynthesis/type III secretory pathway chaperone
MTTTELSTARPSVPELIELLTRQRDLYAQLDRLSQGQMQHIHEGATEQLLSVLSQRQGVVDALGRLSTELAPYREDWQAMSGRLSGDDRQIVRELMDEVDAMLQAILDRDDQARARLQSAQQQTGRELRQAAGGTQAMHAYRGQAGRNPRFADQRG